MNAPTTEAAARLRLLIVDDQPLIRRALAMLLAAEAVMASNPAMDITPVVITALNARIQTLSFERERLDPAPAAAQAPR